MAFGRGGLTSYMAPISGSAEKCTKTQPFDCNHPSFIREDETGIKIEITARKNEGD